MITIKTYNELIKNHLCSNYHPKIYNKHFDYYLEVVQEFLRLYSTNSGFYNSVMEGNLKHNPDLSINQLKLNNYEFRFRYETYKKRFNRRTDVKFLNGYHDKTYPIAKDIHILNVIKADLKELGILIRTRKSQAIIPNLKHTQETFTLDLLPSRDLFLPDNFEFQFRGDFIKNSNSKFHFEIDDLMSLSKGAQPISFLKNYFLMMKLNEDGYHVKKIEVVGRKHHNISQINEKFRAILKCRNGNGMVNYDIKSSFLYWLAMNANCKSLYDDAVTGKIPYSKKFILTWMNTENYGSKRYRGIERLFLSKYSINHELYRNDFGSMYPVLASAESEYVQAISKKLEEKYDNYTLHDQIYFDNQGLKRFWELVHEQNKTLNVKFYPKWEQK